MNNIMIMATKNLETVTSIEVAEMVGKEHKQVLKDIRRYINQLEKIGLEYPNKGKISPVDFFMETTYLDAKGEERPYFNITRKGCEFIANKLTGQKGTEFTAKYVNKLNGDQFYE